MRLQDYANVENVYSKTFMHGDVLIQVRPSTPKSYNFTEFSGTIRYQNRDGVSAEEYERKRQNGEINSGTMYLVYND